MGPKTSHQITVNGNTRKFWNTYKLEMWTIAAAEGHI